MAFMSLAPVFNSLIAGSLLVVLFLWNVSFLPLVIFFFSLSVVIFWFDLLNNFNHYESAFWLFILSEIMAFGSLLTCCFWFDVNNYINLSNSLELPFIGCFLLLGSSITVTGFHHLIYWEYSFILLILTIILGVGFVVLQLVEMNEVFINILDSSFHASSFCTVGLHFSHVLIGAIGLLLVCCIGVQSVGYYRCTLVTWYWHFVDYIWLFVYAFVYVCYYS